MILLGSLVCACPPEAELADLGINACPENFGQVGRLIFRRKYDNLGALNVMTDANIQLWTAWDGLSGAADETKVVGSPKVHNFSQDGGDARTARGGNASLGGVPIVLGSNPSTMTGEFLTVNQDAIAKLANYYCYSNLTVFLVNSAGAVACKNLGTDLNYGFDIEDLTFFVGDKIFGGYEDVDMNPFQFTLQEGWSNTFKTWEVAGGSLYDI